MRTAAISILNIPSLRLSVARRVSYIMIAGALLLAGIFWYVLSVNAVIAMGYNVSDAMSYKESVLTNIETLEARLVQISSPEALEARAGELGFKPVKNASYLAVPGTAVAKR